MRTWPHSGFSVDQSVYLPAGDRVGIERLVGYDNRQRVHQTDASFRVLRQVDLTATHPFMDSYVGRPRLFVRDGRIYLLGRNWTPPPRAMQLCLFRLDPATLTVASYAILDNAERGQINDGYYAMPYFREVGGDTMLYVVNYKGIKGQPGPNILRHEYRWEEVK